MNFMQIKSSSIKVIIKDLFTWQSSTTMEINNYIDVDKIDNENNRHLKTCKKYSCVLY
jgi:hypothetical protein